MVQPALLPPPRLHPLLCRIWPPGFPCCRVRSAPRAPAVPGTDPAPGYQPSLEAARDCHPSASFCILLQGPPGALRSRLPPVLGGGRVLPLPGEGTTGGGDHPACTRRRGTFCPHRSASPLPREEGTSLRLPEVGGVIRIYGVGTESVQLQPGEQKRICCKRNTRASPARGAGAPACIFRRWEKNSHLLQRGPQRAQLACIF
ncbi:hypothetical protein NDU88_007231 [Pleurodeles waltl]|uniref:Uncharacterized protein n=1 Tax=Pleurodeles waltl TaxID=8319 RepID=A0AAV7MF68_PLEWA|nr:hypothetical protein NDU88_007231 [Pleurodeles waltl]